MVRVRYAPPKHTTDARNAETSPVVEIFVPGEIQMLTLPEAERLLTITAEAVQAARVYLEV